MRRPIQRYSPATLRRDNGGKSLLFMGVLWVGLLSAPLAAQQTVVVPNVTVPVTVTPTPVVNNINVMSDSVMIANLVENNRLLREMLVEERECGTCGGTATVVRIGQGALVLVAAFLAWQVKRIADRPPDVNNHTDGDTQVDVEVTVPPHEKHDHKSGKSGKS